MIEIVIKIVIKIVITRSRESEHVHVHAVFHLELEVRVLLRVDFEWGEGHWAGLDVVSVLPFLLKLLGIPRLGGDHSVDLVQVVLPLLEHGHERLAEVLVVGRERRLWNHRALVWDGLRGLGAESTNRVSKQDKEESVIQIVHFPVIWWLLSTIFWSFHFLEGMNEEREREVRGKKGR